MRLAQTQSARGVAVFRGDRALDRHLDVGVVKDDERRVAAQFHRGLLDRGGALLHQQFAHLSRAGEGQFADGRVLVSSPPTSFDGPVTQENTPFGTPARSANSHSAKAENGVAVAGFNTIVQPAAKAGPALRVIIAAGKFHAAHTPIGSLVTTMRSSEACAGIMSP